MAGEVILAVSKTATDERILSAFMHSLSGRRKIWEVIGLASESAALNRNHFWRILVMIAIIPSCQIVMNTVAHVRSGEFDWSGNWSGGKGGVEIIGGDSVSIGEDAASTMFSDLNVI